MSLRVLSRRLSAAALSGIGAVHVAWAAGSSWPLRDRAELADAVVGRRDGVVPSAAACLAVAAALGTGAAMIEGHPRRAPLLSRLGSLGVVTVLCVRAAAGLAGRTDLLSPGSSSPRFRRLDRRIYSPLCLALALLALPALLASQPERP